MTAVALLAPWSVPLQPDGPDGRRLLVDELAKQPYQAARPTPFDLLAQAVGRFLASLFGRSGDPASRVLLVVGVLVVVALLVAALLLYGLPRVNRRSRLAGDALFGAADRRSAAQIRAAAARAAATGDHSLAVVEAFRALARGLEERTLVSLSPGTTAVGFARSAAGPLPTETAALRDAASAFDDVRYAGRPGTEAQWRQITALDERAEATRPQLVPLP
ncbi:DUF4129 domain-containing protein [uncultured Amnibacterium sp.]|uniref:DUF4129 domain-containing protein n=1 Tax=uncultured Amnibacterium sp. TaxID=1631851 RepID=UPI0035CB7039